MGTRRKSRELTMQMLFQMDLGKQTPADVQKTFWKSRVDENGKPGDDEDTRGFAEDIFRVATERNEEIDDLIEAHAQNWRIARMATVDRNLLRMAVAEMIGFTSTPHPIIIDEALEIGRRYAAPESISFLNGVLDAVSRAVMKKRLG
ncbi:MAG: transcription antitermination factor NusB [Acidobacteria bacterium]|nr:transcription antitermination factor NusB [Acidobacteriota bacterium]